MAGPLLRAAATAVGIDPRTFNDVSQAGHFLAGCLAVLGPVALIGRGWGPPICGGILVVAFAAGKEFWYDARYESAEVRGSDIEDFLFYVIGATVSLAAWGIEVWVGF